MNSKKVAILLAVIGVFFLLIAIVVACAPADVYVDKAYEDDKPVARFVDEEYDIACYYRGDSLWCIDLADR